jgi:hypothetical protein
VRLEHQGSGSGPALGGDRDTDLARAAGGEEFEFLRKAQRDRRHDPERAADLAAHGIVDHLDGLVIEDHCLTADVQRVLNRKSGR